MQQQAILAEYSKHNLKYYTPSEEIWNAITHGVGAPLTVVGLVFMLYFSRTAADYIACLAYAIPALLVYTTSAVYHGLTDLPKKSRCRRVDHANVGFLVVACGAPLCLLTSGSIWNYVAVVVCIFLASVNAFFCIYDFNRFKKFGLIYEFAIGLIMVAVYLFNKSYIPDISRILYISGAASCLIGSVTYGIKIKYMHTVFHVLTLIGPMLLLAANILLLKN